MHGRQLVYLFVLWVLSTKALSAGCRLFVFVSCSRFCLWSDKYAIAISSHLPAVFVDDAVSSFAFCLFLNSFHGLLAGAEAFGWLRKATCSFSIVESQHEQIFQSWQ